MTDSMGIGGHLSPLERGFGHILSGLTEGATVLELGTLRWEPDRPTHHRGWIPAPVNHVRSDIEAGTDVDVVADAHTLTDTFGPNTFDAVLAVSVWEHLRLPWIATQELHAVLKPGAHALVVTHHCFPRHGYPNDYTRWDANGLAAMFEWAGFPSVATEHAHPCQIIPPDYIERWSPTAPTWLNVVALARK